MGRVRVRNLNTVIRVNNFTGRDHFKKYLAN